MNDIFVLCPFNNSHQILRSKLIVHLTKCEKQYKHLGLQRCPYNNTHRYTADDMLIHKQVCPNKTSDDELILVKKEEGVQTTNDDDWSNEVGLNKYNSRNAAENKPVFRKSIGLTKSQKRVFLQAEKKRLKQWNINI